MKNMNEIDLASLFNDIKEPSYDDDFTKKVTGRINEGQRTRRILKISLSALGIVIFVGIAPWLLKQTGFVIVNSNPFVQTITLVCLSPAGWVMSSMVLLYSLLKTR